jgi:uncharacterized membrane protein YeaQ/YmgE (transglycosylase-associated protein family)
MHFSLLGFLVLLLVAAVCGGIGRAIAGGSRGGCVVSMAVGFIGALLGVWIAGQLKLPELFVVTIEGHPFPILWSIIGSALFVGVVHLMSGRR